MVYWVSVIFTEERSIPDTNDVDIELSEGSRIQVVHVFGIVKKEISVAFMPNVDEYEFGTGVLSTDDFRIEVEYDV